MTPARRIKKRDGEGLHLPQKASGTNVPAPPSEAQPPKTPAPGIDVSMAVVEILDVSLLKVNAERRVGPVDTFVPVIKRSSKEYFVDGPDLLRVRPTFTLLVHPSAQSPDASEEDFIAKVEASFEIRYRIENVTTFGHESLAAFARLNGLFNAWPYWRELVQTTGTRMGLPTLIVPPFQPMKGLRRTSAPAPRVIDEGGTQ